jgi:hypothetical protein
MEPGRSQWPRKPTVPARFLRRADGGRRLNTRLPALVLFVLLATMLAARSHNARLVLGVIVLGLGLGFVGYAQRLSRLDRHGTNGETAGRGDTG